MNEPAEHAGKKRLSNKAIVLIACAVFVIPVSYTHLTLPTSDLV